MCTLALCIVLVFAVLQNAFIFNTPLGIRRTDAAIIPELSASSPVGVNRVIHVDPPVGHALPSVGIYAMSGAGVAQVVPAMQLVQGLHHTRGACSIFRPVCVDNSRRVEGLSNTPSSSHVVCPAHTCANNTVGDVDNSYWSVNVHAFNDLL